MSSFGTPDSDLASMLGQQRTPLNYSPSPKRPPEPATSASTPSKKVLKQEVPLPAKHVSFEDTQKAPEQDDSAAPSSKAPAVPEQETPIQLEQAEAHAKADRVLAKDMGVPKKAVTCKSLDELPAALDGPPVPARYYFPEDIEVWVSDKLLEPDDATVKEYFFDHYQGRIAIKDFKTGAISYEVPALPQMVVHALKKGRKCYQEDDLMLESIIQVSGPPVPHEPAEPKAKAEVKAKAQPKTKAQPQAQAAPKAKAKAKAKTEEGSSEKKFVPPPPPVSLPEHVFRLHLKFDASKAHECISCVVSGSGEVCQPGPGQPSHQS